MHANAQTIKQTQIRTHLTHRHNDPYRCSDVSFPITGLKLTERPTKEEEALTHLTDTGVAERIANQYLIDTEFGARARTNKMKRRQRDEDAGIVHEKQKNATGEHAINNGNKKKAKKEQERTLPKTVTSPTPQIASKKKTTKEEKLAPPPVKSAAAALTKKKKNNNNKQMEG